MIPMQKLLIERNLVCLLPKGFVLDSPFCTVFVVGLQIFLRPGNRGPKNVPRIMKEDNNEINLANLLMYQNATKIMMVLC